MPLLLPKQRGARRQANFSGRPNTAWGNSLTSDSVAHTEPATPTELIAATDFDTDWVNIWFHTNAATNTDTSSLVNIKVGSAGNEQTIIPNLLAGWVDTLTSQGDRHYAFPLRIPAGTRISGTHRSIRTATSVKCMIELLGGGSDQHWTGTAVEAVGADTADSGGTSVTLGGASEGTLTSIGTTARDWGFVQPMVGGNADTSSNAGVATCDLASDGSTPIPGLEEFRFLISSSEYMVNKGIGRYCHVPAGTTLYLRAQTSTTAEAMDFVCYGVY